MTEWNILVLPVFSQDWLFETNLNPISLLEKNKTSFSKLKLKKKTNKTSFFYFIKINLMHLAL